MPLKCDQTPWVFLSPVSWPPALLVFCFLSDESGSGGDQSFNQTKKSDMARELDASVFEAKLSCGIDKADTTESRREMKGVRRKT